MQGDLIRVCGGAAVVLSCLFLGLSKAYALQLQNRCLSAMISALNIAVSEIGSLSSPTPEVLRRLSLSAGAQVGDFFAQVLSKLEQESGEGLDSLWRSAVNDKLQSLSLTQREEIAGLSQTMGRYDGEEQAAAMRRCIIRLEAELETVSEKASGAMRLYGGLGLCAGLMLTFIMI